MCEKNGSAVCLGQLKEKERQQGRLKLPDPTWALLMAPLKSSLRTLAIEPETIMSMKEDIQTHHQKVGSYENDRPVEVSFSGFDYPVFADSRKEVQTETASGAA